jgi:hypothetical protein
MTDPPDRLTETPQILRLSDEVDKMIDGLIGCDGALAFTAEPR